MAKKMVVKKFETINLTDAEKLVEKLNLANYPAKNFDTGVVTRCRETKKLDLILSKFMLTEFVPSAFDLESIN